MPPKRKSTRKAKPKTQTPPSPQPVPEPEPEPEPVIEPTPPVVEETPAPDPSPTPVETLDPPSDDAAATETRELETLAQESEPMETETLADAEEGSESGKKRKTVTRVRKVVKKKIVKKLVAKSKEDSSKAAEEEAEVAQKVEGPSSDDAPVTMETESTVLDAEKVEAEQEIVPDSTVPEAEKVETVCESVLAETGAVDAENIEALADTEVVDAQKVEDAVKDEDKVQEAFEKEEKVDDVVKEEVKVENVVKEEEEKAGDLEAEVAGEGEAGVSERSARKKTEIFVGGLDRDAKEEDLRKVFGTVGEIVEVRMIMDGQTGKNKGYAFVRYADASLAKKAVTQFEKVEICGKLCGASALKGNDTIFLGNIDKKWKKEDIAKLLQEAGIDKIEAVTVMPDTNNADFNRGFAFLELETNKDAQNAYKKLQKKDALGKGLNIKIAWAEPLNEPDEEEMKKVKSVYAEGIPISWNEEKLKDSFKKYGEIERIVLACNIKSSKRKDFAFVNYKTRQAALSCIESFDKEEITDNGMKINMKVSLAKRVQKGKQNKGGPVTINKASAKEKSLAVQRDTIPTAPWNKGKSSGGYTTGHLRPSTNHELLHVMREQATWKQGQVGYSGGPSFHDYTHGVEGKRPFSSLGDEALFSESRGYPRARLDNFPSTGSSYGAMTYNTAGPPHPYYQRQGAGYAAGAPYAAPYGATDYPPAHQMRQGARPYGSNYYSRY